MSYEDFVFDPLSEVSGGSQRLEHPFVLATDAPIPAPAAPAADVPLAAADVPPAAPSAPAADVPSAEDKASRRGMCISFSLFLSHLMTLKNSSCVLSHVMFFCGVGSFFLQRC